MKAMRSVFLIILAGTLVSSCESRKPAITMDISQPRSEVSKYIYGQFIEHLGRCIYGGIWAEMLEDRKFFYPIKGEKAGWESFTPGETTWEGSGIPYEILVSSPWEVIGDPGQIQMETRNSFVGDQTPLIRLQEDKKAIGISQGRLGLVEGKRYTGYAVLAGTPHGVRVEISLVWGEGESERDTAVVNHLSADYGKTDFQFTGGKSTGNARLEIVARGKGLLRIGTVSLMPADNVRGFRKDTLDLMKQLDSPVYRWPGGNFVSGYDWKDGIGNRDRRPPRKNPAWKGIEANDVGLHEFMDLCGELNTEPFVTVNTGLGRVESARQEVEYANGSVESPMGMLRAENGHREPFGVKWWAVGNEMYGDWQLGHMPLSEYVQKHNRVVDAMRSVDPDVKVVAVGNVGPWSEGMLGACADHMDLISEHFYVQEEPDVAAHVALVPSQIDRIVNAHRSYRQKIKGLEGRQIGIAIDEYNYWYGAYRYGELGTRYYLKDALGIARGIQDFIKNSDIVFMANYAQTVNVIGCIKTSKTSAEFAATGLVLKLYRNHFGVIPVDVRSELEEPVDVIAALTADRKKLTVGVVNPTSSELAFECKTIDRSLSSNGRQWTVSGPDAMSFNVPGEPRNVDLTETALENGDFVAVPPLSASVIEFQLMKQP